MGVSREMLGKNRPRYIGSALYIALITQNHVHCLRFVVFGYGWFQSIYPYTYYIVNTLRPQQNMRHFADDIFNLILLYENYFYSNFTETHSQEHNQQEVIG